MKRVHRIGRKTPGHPLLWLASLVLFAVLSALAAHDEYTHRGEWPNALSTMALWLGASVLLLWRAALVARLCWKMYDNHPGYGPGHCRRCGYDIRATPERCPECGLQSKKQAV
jgi:hypothetical protein